MLVAQLPEGLGIMAGVIFAVMVLFVLLIIVAVFANYFRLWIQSFLTGRRHQHLGPDRHDLPQGQPKD